MTFDINQMKENYSRRVFLHMKYEYPQIDEATRSALADELALISLDLIEHDRLFHQGTRTRSCV